MVGGRKKLSGRQEDVCTKVTLSICKNIVPETDRLKAKAYERIANELSSLGVSPRYVADVWRKYKKQILDTLNEDLIESLKHRKGAGPPRRISIEDLQTRVKAVPFGFRKNIRTLAYKVGIPYTTLHRALKIGCLQKSKNSIKPFLTPQNKTARVAYCRSFVEEDGWFGDMMDHVDIDEKWFYLTEVVTKYILVPGEVPPYRTCKHKSHIIKAMCLTAMARPQKNPETGEWWDGKIGTWFFVRQEPAQRSLKNRPAGTLEMKSYKVNRKETITMYLNNLLPAIVEKWPTWETKKIRIQLDNAKPHPTPGKLCSKITDRLGEYSALGFDINFTMQPANSPDMNTLDLAFFRAIQSLQYQKSPKDVDEMIEHVMEAYRDLPLDICKRVWTTAQLVMNQVLLINGGNDYKLPHVGKLKIVSAHGRDIPLRLPCQALISGDHLNADAIGDAFVSIEQGTPPVSCLFPLHFRQHI
jgi:hypothetical protein